MGIFSPISDLFGWLMRFFYQTISGMFAEPAHLSYFAITILLMAIVSKLITIPLMAQTMKSSARMQDIQPKLDQIRKKYGYDERILNQKIQEFYKEEGVSMTGCTSCLPTLIQLVLIVALFQVLREPGRYLFGSVEQFNAIAKNFFWVKDLVGPDPLTWFGLPLANAVLQFALQYFSPQRQQTQAMSSGMNTTLLLMPVVFYFMSIMWASGLLLYWSFGNLVELIYRGIIFLINRPRGDEPTERRRV